MTSLKELFDNPVVERAAKTAVETGIAAAATTSVISTSSIEKVLVTAGATFLSVLWNGIEKAVAARKDTKLTALETAIESAVNAKLAEASAVNKPGTISTGVIPEVPAV